MTGGGRFGRVLGVTALLAALGGITGALGGALIALGLIAFLETRPSFSILSGIFGAAATVGFSVGVLAGPILTWTLLRRAPIWRAIGETALAAGLGAALSLAFAESFWSMIGVSVGSAVVAALRLRYATRKAIAASSEPPQLR